MGGDESIAYSLVEVMWLSCRKFPPDRIILGLDDALATEFESLEKCANCSVILPGSACLIFFNSVTLRWSMYVHVVVTTSLLAATV